MAEKKKVKAKSKAKARVLAPPLPFDELVQRGEQALLLFAEHPDVGQRLEAGVVPNLRADLDVVTDKRSTVIDVHTAAKASTRAQNDALATLHARVSGLRLGVLKSTAPKAVKTGYGLNKPIRPTVVTSVVGAAKTIVTRAEKQKDEARGLGILDGDVAALKTDIASVTALDGEQEKIIAAKPLSARERNVVGQRIWGAVRSISSKGVMAFATNEPVRARFDVLDDLPKRKRATG